MVRSARHRVTKGGSEHVRQAAEQIRGSAPPRREGQTWTVEVGGSALPPKYLMSVAYRIAHGEEPGVWDVHTDGAVRRLRRLGFGVMRDG
jgi:hypothetical protein